MRLNLIYNICVKKTVIFPVTIKYVWREEYKNVIIIIAKQKESETLQNEQNCNTTFFKHNALNSQKYYYL